MINVTEEAKAMLLGLRRSAEASGSDVGLRLAPGAAGQLELYADRWREGDHVVKHEVMRSPAPISIRLLYP